MHCALTMDFLYFSVFILTLKSPTTFSQTPQIIARPYFKLFCTRQPPATCQVQCRGRSCDTNCFVDGCQYDCEDVRNGDICLPEDCDLQDFDLCRRWCHGGGNTNAGATQNTNA